MHVVILGPTGPTGRELIRQATAAGLAVTAFARRPEAISSAESLHVVRGDVTNREQLREAFSGAGAVLSALGSREMRRPTTIYSASAAAIIDAMRERDVRRFISISAIPVIPASRKTPLNRYLLDPLLQHFFGGGYDDMRRMEHLLAASDLDWTVFRPPYLTDAPARGRYRTAIDAALPFAFSISRADLAAAMIAAIHDRAFVRHAVTIG